MGIKINYYLLKYSTHWIFNSTRIKKMIRSKDQPFNNYTWHVNNKIVF